MRMRSLWGEFSSLFLFFGLFFSSSFFLRLFFQYWTLGCERKKKPQHILIEKQHSKIQATELPLLIGPGLISCSFNLAEPENVSKDEDEQDPTVIAGASDKEGIMAFNKTLTNELMHALTEDENRPKGLRALNTTLYTLSPEQIRKVMATHTGLMVVSMTAEIEPGEETKKALLGAMEQCKDLEQVEIVANPSLPFFMGQYLLLSTCPTLRSMSGVIPTSGVIVGNSSLSRSKYNTFLAQELT